MRRVYALLGLVRQCGEARVELTCRLAVDAQMHDVRGLERMLQAAATVAPHHTAVTQDSRARTAPAICESILQYSLPFSVQLTRSLIRRTSHEHCRSHLATLPLRSRADAEAFRIRDC
jgi:hypothetical protein